MWRKNCWRVEIVFVIFCFLFLQLVSAIRINEVMYHPPQDNNYNEWIEIYNNGTEEINLSTIKLCNDGLLDGYINRNDSKVYLNTTTILGPNSYAIITDGGSGTEAYSNFNISMNALAIRTSSSSLCGGLTDTNKTFTFNNLSGEILSSLTYTSSTGANGNGKTLQFCNGTWTEAEPSPGQENSCIQTNQNTTNQTNNSTANTTQNEYIKLEYDEMRNGKEFEVEIFGFNLKNGSYDVKIAISFTNNDTIISETYNNGTWKSSNYYAENVFNEYGNKSEILKLRIKNEYKEFYGEVNITAKLRKNGDVIAEITNKTELLKKNNTSAINSTNPAMNIETNAGNNSPIRLNSKDIKSKEISENKTYMTKTQYIKEYGIYLFAGFCVFVIIILLIRKF